MLNCSIEADTSHIKQCDSHCVMLLMMGCETVYTTVKQALKLCYVIKQHSPYIQQKVPVGAVRFCPMASMFIHRVQKQVKT